MHKPLSPIYHNQDFFVVAYDTGYQNEIELVDKTFTTKAEAKEWIKVEKRNFYKLFVYCIHGCCLRKEDKA